MASICMYTPSARGGHALYTFELMNALSQHARDGRCFELVTSEDLADQFKSEQYPIHAILPRLRDRKEFVHATGWAANRFTHYPRREATFLKWLEARPDITGVHFQEKHWLAGRIFKRLHESGRKVFYTVHNVRPHQYPVGIPKAMMDRWNRASLRMCDGLFCHTKLLANELGEFLRREHPPIHISPHGTWTVNQAVDVAPVPERMKWKRLLFFGAIRRYKGLDLLLTAAESLAGFSITIAGEPDDWGYFNHEVLPHVERLRRMGVAVEVLSRFIPEQEVGPLFARHSAIILPYTREFVAQSGVVFLALAHELPVVASEVGGLRDLFAEFEIGVTFSDLTPGGIAAAIRNFFQRLPDGQIVQQMRLAKSHYSWSTAADATIAGYGI
jgi:glycosyltransferase involved in cell wall biosynthesis